MKRYTPVLYGCIEDVNGKYVLFDDAQKSLDRRIIQHDLELKNEVKKFFEFLDYTEESDSGKEFHPVTIGCCRGLMIKDVDECLTRMRELAKPCL